MTTKTTWKKKHPSKKKILNKKKKEKEETGKRLTNRELCIVPWKPPKFPGALEGGRGLFWKTYSPSSNTVEFILNMNAGY